MSKILYTDLFEFPDDATAQTAYVTDAGDSYTSQYPPAHSSTYVKATTERGAEDFYAYSATNPALSLIGSADYTSWMPTLFIKTNQRFHIDLGSAKTVKRIYYENFHSNGAATDQGVKNFTIWGSDTEASFLELTYGTDTGWTQITPAQSTFDEHVAANQADPKYITLTNSTAYRYYAFKFADTHGSANHMGLRHVELQIEDRKNLQSYSESTIKQQGTYSLKGVAVITDSLNDTLTKTLTDYLDYSIQDKIVFQVRSSRTGETLQLQIHDIGGTTSTHNINIAEVDVWQTETWDISGITGTDRDTIDKIIIKVINADAANTFYFDNLFSEVDTECVSTWVGG